MEQKQYPAEFVERVKKEYPDWGVTRPDLHKALDSGNQFVGRYLDDSSQGGIDPKEVVKMIDLGQIQGLRQKADKLARRQNLYRDWSKIAQKMFYS